MIQLFHKGTSHVYNGITCKMITVNEFGYEHLLKEGWCYDPKDCYAEKEKPVKKSEVVKTAEKLVEKLVEKPVEKPKAIKIIKKPELTKTAEKVKIE